MAKTTIVNKQDIDNKEIMEVLEKYALEYGTQELSKVLFIAVVGVIQGQLPSATMLNNALPTTNISNIMNMLGGNNNIGNVRELVRQRQHRLR